MLQRVGLAQALVNDPEIVFLDEPMSGLDPVGRREVRDLIASFRGEGKTVFMCSHILSDIEVAQRRLDRTLKAMKADKSLAPEAAFLERLIAHLESGKSARGIDMNEDEQVMLADMPLLSAKPIIYVANVDENSLDEDPVQNPHYAALKEFAASENSGIVSICGGLEAELAELEGEEKQMFLEDMGLSESGLNRLIRAGYDLLGLISFLTAGPKEVRAWTIRKGTKAPGAAGKIHSDFERGFIRAEIVAFDDLMRLGSMTAAKEAGLVRSEGKEYVMKDGDVTLFRFNV
jgi:GTP-binding protein YchF